MKSIRRSLVLKVLILLAVTLAAVFGLAYEIVERTLDERKRTSRELFDLQFNESVDEALRQQAMNLGALTVLQARQRPIQFDYALLGILTIPGSNYGHFQVPIWCLEYGRSGESAWLGATLGTKIAPEDDNLVGNPNAIEHEHMQINGRFGMLWHYPKIGFELPSESEYLTSGITLPDRFDEITLAGTNQRLRRIIKKVTLGRFRTVVPVPSYQPQPQQFSRAMVGSTLVFQRDLSPRDSSPPDRFAGSPRGPRTPLPGSPGNAGPPGPGPEAMPRANRPDGLGTEAIRESSAPNIVVQVAWNLDSGHPRLLEFEAKRREQQEKLETEMQTILAGLRSKFIVIGGIAISILIIGGWLFVGVALKPLQRLSRAVSDISPKDFQLPIEVRTLPIEIHPVANRLRESLTDLKKLFEREKRAAADISHELRTPLAALMTTIEVSLRKMRTEEQYRETLSECREIARQMSHLVEKLLTLAWLDAGADRMSMQNVEVGPLISECSTIGKPLAEAQGLQFRVRIPEPMTVHTDRDKLREVLMNLVHNAIEYNRPGGEIEVTASSNERGGVTFEVRDTGIGISRDMQDKIFERFYRGDLSRNAAGVHAGLGLSIVKEYIDRLGGKLILDSALGEGSRFRIELPSGQNG